MKNMLRSNKKIIYSVEEAPDFQEYYDKVMADLIKYRALSTEEIYEFIMGDAPFTKNMKYMFWKVENALPSWLRKEKETDELSHLIVDAIKFTLNQLRRNGKDKKYTVRGEKFINKIVNKILMDYQPSEGKEE